MKKIRTVMLVITSIIFLNPTFAAKIENIEANNETIKSTNNYTSLVYELRKPRVIIDKLEVAQRGRSQCFSAKKCTGKVIGYFQHAHNCRQAGGKSFLSEVTGQCTNL